MFARQSNADTYPFGFGSPTGGGFNLDNEVFPQWQGSDKQSDFEDNLEDLQELIDSEMTDFDRDLANFVVNGSELPVMLRPPDDDLPVSEDLPGNNMFCAGNLQTSSVPTSGFTAPGQSVSLPSLSKQPVISARKRMAGEDFLEFDDNTGMYTAVVPSLSSSTPRQASVIQSKVPRLNHMSSIPTVTNSAPVPSASAAGSQGLSSMQTQGVPQPNIPSYQMESARYQQNNNGLITANSFQVGNHNRVGGNLNQMAGGAVQGLAPAQGEIVNRTNSYTDELMVDLVDDMLTDPRLHIANEFQKQQDLSNQDRSFDNQGQFKSSSYPLLETKIKQEAPSPTTTQPSFFGTCIGEGNFCQVSENSGTRLNSTAAVGNNTNLRQYSSFQQPSILTHMNQPPNGTMLQGMCPPSSQRSAAFPNQNMGERTFNYLPQTISGGNMQSTEFVSSQMKPQLKQRRLGTLLQQETAPRNLANCNVNSQANFNGTQQQPFSTSDQQNYTIHSTQNNMVSQRKQGLNPSQNVSHHPGFSIANSAPVGFPGSQANTFQGLNSSSNPNIR